MDRSGIAKRYAQAIFGMAKQDDNIDEVREALNVISVKYQEEEDFRNFLLNPTVTSLEKRHLIRQMFGFLTESAMSILNFVIDKERVMDILQIQEKFLDIVHKEAGKLPVVCIFAKELSNDQREKLVKKLEQKYQKKIILDLEVDEKIIGGGIIKIGDTVINGSIKHQIEDMKRMV